MSVSKNCCHGYYCDFSDQILVLFIGSIVVRILTSIKSRNRGLQQLLLCTLLTCGAIST